MSVKNVKHGFCIFEAKPNAAGATTKGKPAGMMGVTIVFLGPRTKKTNLLYAVLLFTNCLGERPVCLLINNTFGFALTNAYSNPTHNAV